MSLKAYCVSCRTGSENSVAGQINHICDNVQAIAPVRVLLEKRQRRWESTERLLIPGYIFLYTENNIEVKKIKALSKVYRVLQYDNGFRELLGSDYEYAKWIYRHNGRIGPSKALIEGSKVKVVDGPLANGIGNIIKLDKHKRRALVAFEFCDRIQKVSLSVVDLESCE